MNIRYWNYFSKKKNSTLRPTWSEGIEVSNVRLKDGTSWLHPTLILSGNNLYTATEVYFDINYYFVADCRSIGNDLWELDLEIDALATEKDVIGNYTGLITRTGDMAWFNTCIRDELNPPTEEVSFDYTSDSQLSYLINPDASSYVKTFYILNVVSDAPQSSIHNTNGFCRTYLLYADEMTQLLINLNTGNLWEQIKNALGNPMDAIVSCHKMTFDTQANVIAGAVERMKLGGVDTQKDAKAISNRYYKTPVFSISLPARWFNPYDSYADAAPYVTLTLYLPYVGVVPLDYSIVQDTRTLYYQLLVDFVTGDIVYMIMKTGGGGIVATYEGNMSTKCPVSAMSYNAMQRVGGVITTVGGVAAMAVATGGTGLLAGAGAAAAGVGSTVNSLEVHTQINGNLSSNMGSQMSLGVRINAYIRKPAHGLVDTAASCGLPCMKVGKPSDHPGYCRFQEASVPAGVYDSVRDKINEYMVSGFYYE